MRVELICAGTELLTGKLNTNISYIGERLSSLGLDLTTAVTVGDNRELLLEAFNNSLKNNKIIIVTGGLGPTFDDLTRSVLAEALGKKLVLNREALSEISEYFASKNIKMPKNNESQAYTIDGAKILRNKLGTAPGQLIETHHAKNMAGSLIFLLPGPPREMQRMFEDEVYPLIKKYETKVKKSATLHICGLGESQVDEIIRPVVEAERKLDFGLVDFTILAHQMIVDIKVSVSGKDEMLVDEMLHNIKKELIDLLGGNIYGQDSQTLESIIGETLARAKKTISTAESCTGGLLAKRITDIAGSSMYFRQGFVVYSNEAKEKTLGVSKETLKSYGAVSEQTAAEMARRSREISGSDYAVSITGIAGPSGATAEKPLGLVFIGLCGPKSEEVYKLSLSGARADVRQRAANQALDLLRRRLALDIKPKK
ncbi:MAG TPA: competence/damage-inducible protein A [Elusimicrobia bacterium]|nr:MAG: competence/damage-inducible protein A [Elusimicrobia bacterium RIFOXYA12_FULL_49_49]OGS08894.1 MAG: competence/damage-inducible protein A [Elusimicrobia bacterium RIFOXYA1_FULL_47_7]OGS10478.1 MAG: competence/damage-inducible protein A [Elusimicrobia bacterium RIFOXYB1_FULL_48_9]OGS14701.1 MAG: competence/damage-inducible protein A [Elusimicrobia bacterium RIFOXYA2_FULL_47_53]OGS25647.1 MAG: competence/damage-inducible protein A [Elusimicrobia bacterium RIFOXYB12_FULL_50_12]OGS31792.1 